MTPQTVMAALMERKSRIRRGKKRTRDVRKSQLQSHLDRGG
jgi:hypothetical protein